MEDSIGIESGQSTQHFFFGSNPYRVRNWSAVVCTFRTSARALRRAGLPGEASRGLIREYAAWRRDGNRHRLGCRTAATRRANRDSPLVRDHRVPPKVKLPVLGSGNGLNQFQKVVMQQLVTCGGTNHVHPSCPIIARADRLPPNVPSLIVGHGDSFQLPTAVHGRHLAHRTVLANLHRDLEKIFRRGAKSGQRSGQAPVPSRRFPT